MNSILICFAILTVSGAGITRAMVPVNPYGGLNVIALLQWYQSYYPNAPVPAHLLPPTQQQTAGQPQTNPSQALPIAPSAPAPQSQSPFALVPALQPQYQPQSPAAPQPNPNFQPHFQSNPFPSHYPVATEHINMHQGRGMQNMPNVDPVSQMLLMAARMKRKYRRGEPLPRMPPFFPGGWVIAVDGSDASVLGKDGRTYTIDSNRICIAGRCARVL